MTDRIRDSFETWAKSEGFRDFRYHFDRYPSTVVRNMWEAWKKQAENVNGLAAALARAQARNAELVNQCRDHDARRTAAMAQAASLAEEVDRLTALVSALTKEGRDAAEMQARPGDAHRKRGILMRENINQLLAKLASVTVERDALAAELAKLREQEPVAWMHDKDGRVDTCHDSVKELWIKVGQKQNTQFMREIVPCRVEHYNIPLYAAPGAALEANQKLQNALIAAETELAKLLEQEPVAYLDYWKSDGTGIVRKQRTTGVPFFNHPIPAPAVPAAIVTTHFQPDDDTRRNDEAFAAQQAATAPSVPDEWRAAMQEAHDTFQRYADLHRAKNTRDGYEKARPYQKSANKLYALLQSADHSAEVKS